MAKLDELKALASDLRQRLRQVDKLTGRASERDRDAWRKRSVRATAKEVQVPLCENLERRTLLDPTTPSGCGTTSTNSSGIRSRRSSWE